MTDSTKDSNSEDPQHLEAEVVSEAIASSETDSGATLDSALDSTLESIDEKEFKEELSPKESSATEEVNLGDFASLSRRGLAYLIDVLLLALLVYLKGSSSGTESTNQGVGQMIVGFLPFIFLLFYFPLFEGFLVHGTIGKMIVRIKVVDQKGRGIRVGRAYGRYAAKVGFGVLTVFLSWFFAFFHPKKQSCHDLVSRCYVVRS